MSICAVSRVATVAHAKEGREARKEDVREWLDEGGADAVSRGCGCDHSDRSDRSLGLEGRGDGCTGGNALCSWRHGWLWNT